MQLCKGPFSMLLPAIGLLFAPALAPAVSAQDNYEIQVYGSDTVPPGHTMFELHNNDTARGSTRVTDIFKMILGRRFNF